MTTTDRGRRPQNGDRPHLPSSNGPQWRARAHAVEVTAADCDLLVDAASGLTIVESASKRGASIDAVKAQRRTLMLKLDARNMTHAIAVALSEGLINRPPRGATHSIR
jgi:DNA-binding NarL/FixJ family response regulator